jgi:hypothetical protein
MPGGFHRSSGILKIPENQNNKKPYHPYNAYWKYGSKYFYSFVKYI